jgi:hypothetical protein
LGLVLLVRSAIKDVKTMNTVGVSARQLMGAALGLLVTVAAIIVNLKLFGSDLSLMEMASFAALGGLVVLTMIVVMKD